VRAAPRAALRRSCCSSRSILHSPFSILHSPFSRARALTLALQVHVCIWDMVFAMTDTTASTNEWLIYFMANHPAVQKKVAALLTTRPCRRRSVGSAPAPSGPSTSRPPPRPPALRPPAPPPSTRALPRSAVPSHSPSPF
jgi:hypothetical protein